ncbi:MAG: HAD family acid phosphatase [Sulfolobales archaeon]
MEIVKEICLFDIDGVLFDVSERYLRALTADPKRGDTFWNIFFSEDLLVLDKPLEKGVENLRKCLEKNYDIIIVSGRPERLREATLKQLMNIGLLENKDFKKLILRRNNDIRKSYVFKIEIVKELTKRYVIKEIHDDDLEFLRRVSHIALNSVLFYYENSCVKILKKLNYF